MPPKIIRSEAFLTRWDSDPHMDQYDPHVDQYDPHTAQNWTKSTIKK